MALVVAGSTPVGHTAAEYVEPGDVVLIPPPPRVVEVVDREQLDALRAEVDRALDDMADAAAQLDEIGGDARDVGRWLRRRAQVARLRLRAR